MYYRIYAKFYGQKNFKPVDTNKGQQVTNLIFASLIHPESLPDVINLYKTTDANFALIQARRVDTNKIIKINY